MKEFMKQPPPQTAHKPEDCRLHKQADSLAR
jgi:hypothetical protein